MFLPPNYIDQLQMCIEKTVEYQLHDYFRFPILLQILLVQTNHRKVVINM